MLQSPRLRKGGIEMKSYGAKILTSLAVVTFVIMGSFLPQEALGQVTVLVDPKATYLHTTCDSPALPTVVGLAAAGAHGNSLKLSYSVAPPGFYLICDNPAFLRPAEQTGILGVFSSSSTLSPPSDHPRV